MPYVVVLCREFFFFFFFYTGCVEWAVENFDAYMFRKWREDIFRTQLLVGHNLWVPFLVLVYDVIGATADVIDCGH